MQYWNAVFAFIVAMAVATALTPLAGRLAGSVGATAKPTDRGLADVETPQLGGLAILAGVLLAAWIWMPGVIHLPHTKGTSPGAAGAVHTWAIVAGACLIVVVGAVDDVRELPPALKLVGQVAAAVVAVKGGVKVT